MDKIRTYFEKDYKGFYICHNRRSNEFDMKLNHFHNNYEIYYLISGERNYFIKDRIYRVEKGDVVLINAFDLHKTVSASSVMHERLLINLTKDFMDFSSYICEIDLFSVFEREDNIIKLEKNEQTYIEGLFFKIINEWREESEGYMAVVKSTILELLVFLNRKRINSITQKYEYKNPTYEKILDITKYINNNYMYDITLDLLSGKFYISTSYLCRVFKKVTGFSFVEYLNSVRIKRAQKLLTETVYNITDIAQKVGYEGPTHFGRVFKAITGISPLKFRKMNKMQ